MPLAKASWHMDYWQQTPHTDLWRRNATATALPNMSIKYQIVRTSKTITLYACFTVDFILFTFDETFMCFCFYPHCTLREESGQTNVILQYKLLASMLSAVCSVIQQS